MISLLTRGTRKRSRNARGRWAAASATPVRRACKQRASGHVRSLPAARQPGATLSLQGLRTWCSPSGMQGNTHPWRGTWGSPFGMLRRGRQSGSATRQAARAGWRPTVLAKGAFARCRSTRRSRGRTQRSAGRLNKTHSHGHGRTRPKPGTHEAGNDCDASRAGLQGNPGGR